MTGPKVSDGRASNILRSPVNVCRYQVEQFANTLADITGALQSTPGARLEEVRLKRLILLKHRLSTSLRFRLSGEQKAQNCAMACFRQLPRLERRAHGENERKNRPSRP
jgi:hypothetical protein